MVVVVVSSSLTLILALILCAWFKNKVVYCLSCCDRFILKITSKLRFFHGQWNYKDTKTKGVGPGPTLAWPGWKQPDIPVEVDTGRLETDVGRQEF